MEATRVPDTVVGTIPDETAIGAMREYGLLPDALPEWKNDSAQPLPPPVVEPRIELTARVHISFEAKENGAAFFMAYCSGYGDLQPFTTIEARKAEVLPMLLADVEKALPVLRAVVANLSDGSSGA